MRAGLREIMIITTPNDKAAFQNLLGDGTQIGISLTYAVQDAPRGIAEALLIAEDFLDGSPSALILGDNLFFGSSFDTALQAQAAASSGATIFGYEVKEPQSYGVVGFDAERHVISLEEKPDFPASNYAITGLYFYDEHASDYARQIQPSGRKELEITDLNRIYLDKGKLRVELLDQGTTWLDTGTHRSLLQAAQFVSVIEERQGRRICCPEVVAYRQGWIDKAQLMRLALPLEASGYGRYLMKVAEQDWQ